MPLDMSNSNRTMLILQVFRQLVLCKSQCNKIAVGNGVRSRPGGNLTAIGALRVAQVFRLTRDSDPDFSYSNRQVNVGADLPT